MFVILEISILEQETLKHSIRSLSQSEKAPDKVTRLC